MKKSRKTGSKIRGSILAFVMIFAFVQLPVKATTTTAKSMMFYNDETKTLLNPPTYSSDKAWVGNKLYWGNATSGSNIGPMKWDILNTSETGFGGNGMLLFYTGDLGSSVFNSVYKYDYMTSTLASVIDASMETSLSDEEKVETIDSARTETSYSTAYGTWSDNFSGKKWFAPTMKMMTEITYGFSNSHESDATRVYKGDYWLSSQYVDYVYGAAGSIQANGKCSSGMLNITFNTRIATNINSQSILFVSSAEGIKGSALAPVSDAVNNEYKLTLKDSTQTTPTITNTERSGNTVTFDYANITAKINQKLSAIITSEDGKEIIEYGVVKDNPTASGKASITLPSDFDTNKYKIKFLSEICNGDKKTDYASKLTEAITLPAEKPVFTTGTNATYQVNDGKDMMFTCSGKLEDLEGIYIDGKLVDTKNYTLKSGSTVLTLKASYLDTLSIGNHTLKLQYKGNLVAETTFTVTVKANSPQTGDTTNTGLYLGLLIIVGAYLVLRKKKEIFE